tara:strand:- start:274 stop:471 length:198 start_codon:yes stop_codon:yes gene_type:complete
MSYLTHLKRTKHCPSCRWVVNRDNTDNIIEVKLVHFPNEYEKDRLLNQTQLIDILQDEREKRKST